MALTPQESLDRDAAEWAVAMERGLSSDEQATLDVWLAKDPRRQGALIRAQAIWAAAVGPTPVEAVRPETATRRRMLVGALAAGVAGSIGLGVHLARERTMRTRRGEVRRLSMADGSEAVMNAQTRMAVRFSEAQRRVDLRNGEAWFDVAKDAARPFVVSTPAAQVVAVGTAFSVMEVGDATEVVVTEGTVRVTPTDGGLAILATAGETVRIDAGRPMRKAALDPGRVRRRLAWREGLIMLDGETLAEAAAEFNRYNTRQIRVSPDVADNRVVGVFRIHDEEGFAKANADLLMLNISSSADEIVLTPQVQS